MVETSQLQFVDSILSIRCFFQAQLQGQFQNQTLQSYFLNGATLLLFFSSVSVIESFYLKNIVPHLTAFEFAFALEFEFELEFKKF